VHLVGFIIRNSHDARSPERQTLLEIRVFQHWTLTSEGGRRYRDFFYFFQPLFLDNCLESTQLCTLNSIPFPDQDCIATIRVLVQIKIKF
jgi:hypothetical protein